MESPSTSTSLTNEKFEEWCAALREQVKNTQNVDAVLARVTQNLQWRFLPFLSWGETIVFLRVWDAKYKKEFKCTAKLANVTFAGVAYSPITLAARGSPIAAQPHHTVVRYKLSGTKRWRKPKPQHEAQVAYYLLKYS